jgi:hypothetical protein
MPHSRVTVNVGVHQIAVPLSRFLQRVFFLSSCAFLFITAVAKIVSAFGGAPILREADPIFGLPFKYVMLLVAALELGVSYLILSSQKTVTKALSILMITSCFALYRFGLSFIGYNGLCPCLGNLGDGLRLDATLIDTFMKVGLAYLISGSILSIISGDKSSA